MTSAAARLYADGLRDGIAMTLQLSLGQDSHSGGVPYPNPDALPADFVNWATQALSKVEDDRLLTDKVAEALLLASKKGDT